jgi:hypothetical protein
MPPFHELKYVTEFSHNSIAEEECIAQLLVQAGPENLTLRSVSAINCCIALTEKAILHTENIIARY